MGLHYAHQSLYYEFSGYAKDENTAMEAKRVADSLSRSPSANVNSTTSNYSYSIAQFDSPFQFIGRTNEVWADIKVSGADGCKSSELASYWGTADRMSSTVMPKGSDTNIINHC
ncbi:hypothetical protein SADUNF_Sadunf12G0067000 [Salix dunnii]|uniref:Uncharacterized protein n=1 Tax=Salix dunnii TaxID=1413687 RepID=A0A835JNF1_9ROSI|nr:hypothetical protein SADUNF_Sadunf12G0067000 [Salix dunnii]